MAKKTRLGKPTQNGGTDYRATIEELRRLAREPFETSEELQQLHSRIATERELSQGRILEGIAQQTHVDLKLISEEVRRRNAEKRRYVTEALTRLESQAVERANAQKSRFHRIRAQYLNTFGDYLGAQDGKTQLKFRDPIFWSGDARPGACTYSGTGFWSPWIGPNSEASAEIAQSVDSPGMWLYPRLYIDSNSCDDMRPGMTFQDLTYRMDPPTTSFGVNSVRVDLIGNGIASSHFGDPPGWFTKPSPLYEHSFVTLDVYIAQQVSGEWHLWPLLSDKLFAGKGEYVSQVRCVLSGQTYSSNLLIRNPEAGGGDFLCLVQVACSVLPIGSDALVRIDCGASGGLGIYVGGVALIGGSV